MLVAGGLAFLLPKPVDRTGESKTPSA
jgi:hypothetical protein